LKCNDAVDDAVDDDAMQDMEVTGPDGNGLTQEGIAGRWLNSWATQLWQNGGMGVDMFFVLSGFLISWFWLKEVQATGRFRCALSPASHRPCPARCFHSGRLAFLHDSVPVISKMR